MPPLKLSLPLLLALLMAGSSVARAADDAVARGKYLYNAADCGGCHGGDVNGGPPGGGKGLATPFGVFHVPNISSDPQFGIGRWTDADFRQALRHGIAPGGKQLFPVFPFPSFSGLTDRDMDDIFAYILTLPAATTPNKPHEVKPPFGWRWTMLFWRSLFFTPGPLPPVADRGAEWNRGNYLVQAVAHCGECHTPRNLLGALRGSRAFSGNIGGPDGQNAPNITSDKETGIGTWTVEEIEHLLKTGETPDFDSVASGMAAVVRGTSKLSDADRHAIAVYIASIPPIHTQRPPPKPAS